MGDVISELKKIGIKQISQKTLITEKNIESIIEKDFKSLQRTKANGFIKIIEREFKVDLSGWSKEYQEYLKTHKVVEEDHFMMSDPDKENSGNKLINLFTYFIIFISVIGLFYILSDINTFKQEEVKQVKDLVEEAKVNLETTKELNNSGLNGLKDEMEANDSINSNEIVGIDENLSEEQTPPIIEENVKEEELKDAKEEVKEIKLECYIKPKFKVWAGIITLPEYKKREVTSNERIVLDPSKEQLISLGHNKIEIFVNGEKINIQDKERFLYKDGEIKPLTYSEFRKLNRGKNW